MYFLSSPLPTAVSRSPPGLPPLCRSLMDSTWCRCTSCTWLGASDALFLGLSIGPVVSAGAARGRLRQRVTPSLLGGF